MGELPPDSNNLIIFRIFLLKYFIICNIIQLDKNKILAFVTVQGSTNSHTAILARMMNIPALVNVPMDLNKLHTGMNAIVDGILGEVAFEPTEEEMNTAKSRVEEEKEKFGRFLAENEKGLKLFAV